METTEKVRVKDAFYGMRGLSLNHEHVTGENIHKFKLHVIFESKTADIYSTVKRTRIKIMHVKDKNYYPEFRHPDVDWFESPVKEAIQSIKKYESLKRRNARSHL